MRWIKILNFFSKISSNTSTPLPDKKDHEDEDILVRFLAKYPHLSSMKNFKVLELIRENQMLTKELEEYKRSHIDQEELLFRIARKYGYKVSREGYFRKGR